MSKVSKRSVQHGLERQITGRLQTLWIELAGFCNLACAYCYACGGERLDRARLLSWKDYERILIEAKNLGVDSIGIPGAGEPFLEANLEMTMKFLHKCAQLKMFVTVFTTGEFITEQLADELLQLPVELMVKGNTLKPELQDRFVSDPSRDRLISGYGEKRNQAIELLVRKGFNDRDESLHRFGRPSRMALVTSIMTSEHGELSNLDEVADVLRFCREHNIIFDCDTLLEHGRGATCGLCTKDRELKETLLKLQAIDRVEFGNDWQIGPGYVGTACDRYGHHMYVNQYGEIRPCIGAMDVVLGNIRDTKLEKAWNSSEMQIIRQRKFGGVCASCAHFVTGECNSCLGRHTENLNNEHLTCDGCVQTVGCWNFERLQ